MAILPRDVSPLPRCLSGLSLVLAAATMRYDAPIVAHNDNDSEAKRARAARFRAEAKKPPPPLPTKRIAWAGGKIATNSKDECLRKLLERKLAAGAELTDEQQRALRALQPSSDAGANAEMNSLAKPPTEKMKAVVKKDPPKQQQPRSQPARRPQQPEQQQFASQAACAEQRKLLKKVRDIEQLEAKVAAGATLEANQHQKIQGKAALLQRLAQLS